MTPPLNQKTKMRTTKKERAEVMERLRRTGIEYDSAQALRRIAMTLHNWFELECGTGDDRTTRSIERDGPDGDGKPFLRVQYQGSGGKWIDRKSAIPDRETGARKRLAAIMAGFPLLICYVQTDCRGAALFIVPKASLKPGEDLGGVCSSRGVAVY